MMSDIDFHVLVSPLHMDKQVEFQGPIVQHVAHSSNSNTVNVTYTSVTNIELRNPNGFEV